ncbi:hypothetical protein IFM89_003210 [Coptis chinensis]|uniref:Glutamate-5-semialdehyde dehydrogenase n=1 Tax=Coptis chinensis TaxID=261450 RepID=A0A835H2Y6_9MAGN|nr:hypothetical protein IFM89_003210 [Coptis chinensis]
MALYDVLFSQLDVTSSQLLVTDNDFRDPDFRLQLSETVNSLLSLRVVPIFNENDLISTRRAPYEKHIWRDNIWGIYAAHAGIPVIITSGFATDNIIKVLQGERVGTLFHQDAHLWTPLKEVGAREMAVAARDCSRRLQISGLAKSIRVLADMEEPIGQILKRTELADGLILDKTSSPLGVLLIVFESRPDALVQIASLAIRSGNGLLLKGGKEAKRSNAILHKVITAAIPENVGEKLIGLVTSREEIPDLLKHDDVIDLVIPRGSNKLVSQIKESTKIPVLGHAGMLTNGLVSFEYLHMEFAMSMLISQLTWIWQNKLFWMIDYPAACNAMETLLVHNDLVKTNGFNELIVGLNTEDMVGCTSDVPHVFLTYPLHEPKKRRENKRKERAHTDCIVTEDRESAEAFLHQVDSAAVFHNASTRFCDGARFGLGAEVGISTSRIHARGPVGVEGLLTTRWILRGSGQVVDSDKGVIYTHKNIELQSQVVI